MRNILVFASVGSLVGLSVACSSGPSARGPTRIGTTRSAIIGGDLDPDDPSVIELLYIVGLTPAACGGDMACTQTCHDGTGQQCSSGATCLCGPSAECTGELVGPHSVLTAGHCTDLVAGGTLVGPGGPALTLCTSPADVMTLASGTAPRSGCNVDILALFNNRCSKNDLMESCEISLIENGDYIIGDKVMNPGYDASVRAPYSAANNDHDIGLVRLSSTTLLNGGAEPDLLVFNRADLGSQCTDLGDLKSVGYGISQPSQGSSALSGLKYAVTHDAKVKDTWHIEADGPQPDGLQSCGVGTSDEPTCEGDSGGPSFDGAGHIMGVTSLGDEKCSTYGESTRTDAYADWIDTTMAGWGDPKNGTVAPPDSGAATACDACAGGDTGAPSVSEASVPEGDDASTGEASARVEVTAEGSASGGCSVGARVAASPVSRQAGTSVSLLIMAATFMRRRAKRGR